MKEDDDPTMLQNLGIVIIVLTIGIPVLDHLGFCVLLGMELNWGFSTCLIVATVGGAIGGALLGDEHVVAGLIGGLLSGPGGFLALHFYFLDRESVGDYEALFVQLVGSLRGIAVFHILKHYQSEDVSERETELAFADERSN